MNLRLVTRTIAFASALCLVVMSPAYAQATRTWVSGVGDDANPCSRTAPCKTFAGAISKTAAKGEISVLDPGGYGAVTITKSMTIDGNGQIASILASGTTGVTINAGVNDVVTLRNITINGAGATPGVNGIKFLAGKGLHLDNVKIQQFQAASPNGNGIAFTPAGFSYLFVTNSVISRNGTYSAGALSSGIFIKPTLPAGYATVVLQNVNLEGNVHGVRSETGSVLVMRHSNSAGNVSSGIQVVSAALPGATAMLDSVNITNNGGNGILSSGANAFVRISDVSVYDNYFGLKSSGAGQIISFKNNRIATNSTNGAPTGTALEQ